GWLGTRAAAAAPRRDAGPAPPAVDGIPGPRRRRPRRAGGDVQRARRGGLRPRRIDVSGRGHRRRRRGLPRRRALDRQSPGGAGCDGRARSSHPLHRECAPDRARSHRSREGTASSGDRGPPGLAQSRGRGVVARGPAGVRRRTRPLRGRGGHHPGSGEV
ncbi:MAG: hypothetical protein AVDCRST_MAG36-2319, partial [uncultured Nocardioidaceae bacterium]